MPSANRALWLLPFACAVIPAVAIHVAWVLSRMEGYVPDCIPHVEGCTSISRAARHGIANSVFKLLMLPCAVLQGLHWWVAARWVRARHPDAGAERGLAALGIVAAAALALYAAFLGVDGSIYGWLRRYGITFYFAASFAAMLVFLRRLRQIGEARGIARAMLALCVLLLLLGIASPIMKVVVTDPALEDRLENVLEWQLGALFTAWFLLHAALWRRAG